MTHQKRSFDQSILTPVRVQMPRISRLRTATSAMATPLETPDRFIPNRSRMTMSSHSLLSTTSKPRAVAIATVSDQQYDRQLQSVLLGKHTNSPSRLLEFGPNKKHRTHMAPTRLFPAEQENPFRHDVLRSLATNGQAYDPRRLRRCNRLTIECTKVLDAPDFHSCSDLLHLIGSGKKHMAVALENRVYLKTPSGIELLAKIEAGCLWTCLQWSTDGELLALSTMGNIFVYDPSSRQPIAEMTIDSECTAMAWKGRELVAVFTEERTARYDLEAIPDANGETPVRATYEGHGIRSVVTSVQWNGNTIATAGGGLIKMFDANKGGAPLRVIKHTGVKCLEFCPLQPNLLVSGGSDGLKIWSIWNGQLRGSMPTAEPVTATICSTQGHEIVVAHGSGMSLWSLATSKGQKLFELSTVHTGGDIVNMKRGLDGKIICAHGEEKLTLFDFRQEVSKERARSVAGMLVIPTLR